MSSLFSLWVIKAFIDGEMHSGFKLGFLKKYNINLNYRLINPLACGILKARKCGR